MLTRIIKVAVTLAAVFSSPVEAQVRIQGHVRVGGINGHPGIDWNSNQVRSSNFNLNKLLASEKPKDKQPKMTSSVIEEDVPSKVTIGKKIEVSSTCEDKSFSYNVIPHLTATELNLLTPAKICQQSNDGESEFFSTNDADYIKSSPSSLKK